MKTTHNIGLFGFGCVGQGLHNVRTAHTGSNIKFSRIAIQNPDKSRILPPALFTTDERSILEDPAINTVVELINDSDEALHIIHEALRYGKNVVSANKKCIAEHLGLLIEFQQTYGGALLYEGSVAGAIPVIRNLENYYGSEPIESVRGILNGSSNYILSKIVNENLSYEAALQQAQENGFAEANPTLDVGGYDANYKLTILALHAYGLVIDPRNTFRFGIQNLQQADFDFARENHLKIRLVAQAIRLNEEQVALSVAPEFVSADDPLYHIENENNAVVINATYSGEQVFKGKGAGGNPTGAAVLTDITALESNYRYPYHKLQKANKPVKADAQVDVYIRYQNKKAIEQLKFNRVDTHQNNTIIGKINLEELRTATVALEADQASVILSGNVEAVNRQQVQTRFRRRSPVHA